MSDLELGPYLNDMERAELEAMYALIVQTEMKYVQDANRRGILCRGEAVKNWFQTVDDPESKGWQSALSAMSHIFGELRGHYETESRKRAGR